MKPDVIVQWCVFNDYPLFRKNIQDNRDRFGKVILYPSRHHGTVDLEEFARLAFSETWVTPVLIDYGKEDWRQAETDPCLKHVVSDWVWFREQDFFVDDWDKFYSDMEKAMKVSDAIGWWNETNFPYLHPCCLLIKREVLERTKKDFRAHPEINGCDHFAMLTRDLEAMGAKITKLQDLGYEEWENCFHLGGLTYPYQNWKGDGTDIFGVKNISVFYIYNYWSRKVLGPKSSLYVDLSLEIESRLNTILTSVNVEKSHWVKYFKI